MVINCFVSLVYSSQECTKEILVNELLSPNSLPSRRVQNSIDILDRPLVILGCNGGGIRGYSSARVLEELEKAVGSTDKPFPIYQMIHGSIGSSTGTIISAAITLDPKYWKDTGSPIINSSKSIPALLAQLYRNDGPYIFSNVSRSSCLWGAQNNCFGSFWMQLWNLFRPKYNGKHLKEVLNKYFGNFSLIETRPVYVSSYINDHHNHKKIELAMVTCDMKTGTTFEFNSKSVGDGRAPNFFVRDAVLASCAQATTFPTAHIHPIHGDSKQYDESQVFDLIDEGPLDNPVFQALQMGLKQLQERGIDPMQYFCEHYQDYKEGKRVKPLLRIVHISTGHHTTVLNPSECHNAGILKLAPTLVTTILENQSVYSNETVEFFAKILPFVEFYNLEGETTISALEDDKTTSETFTELERLAKDIVANNPDFRRLADDIKKDFKM